MQQQIEVSSAFYTFDCFLRFTAMLQKSLKVTYLSVFSTNEGLYNNPGSSVAINELNWTEYPYCPEVTVRLSYSSEALLITFDVSEKSVRAVETNINGPVHNDSCVEFFISFDKTHYYNFEFSCIGTPHLAYGPGRSNREKLSTDVVSTIIVNSTLGKQPFDLRTGEFTWQLSALIPLSCFVHHPGLSLKGQSATANFYKCGDALPEPHFVSWNPIATPEPDYHRPEFFGKLIFE